MTILIDGHSWMLSNGNLSDIYFDQLLNHSQYAGNNSKKQLICG